MRFSRGLPYSIVVHGDACADIDALWETDEDAAADIETFLDEARHNQDTLDSMTRQGYVSYGDYPYDVKEWKEAKRQRYNLWRLRLLYLKNAAANHRIVYCFHPIENRYYVLGIVEREFDYDINHPKSRRILATYDALDVPRY